MKTTNPAHTFIRNTTRQCFQPVRQWAMTLCLLALVGTQNMPAQAAIQRSADFEPGQTIGIGLYGMSYDYGIGFFSAGFSVQSPSSLSLSNPLNDPLRPGLRLAGKFYQHDGLSADVLGGLLYDPGRSGERPLLVPDLGLGLAYDFRQYKLPFVLRMNLTLAITDGLSRYDNGDQALPNVTFFQRLSFGPQTSLELAWLPTKHLEVTLGGGTLLGMRLKF